MKIKKLFAFAISSLLILGLVGCKKDSNIETNETTGGGEKQLTLAWYGTEQNKTALDKNLQKFTDETGIGVKTVFVAGSWSDYFTKLQTMAAGGEAIDAAYVAIEGYEMLVDLEMAQSFDDWIAGNKESYDKVVSDIEPNVLEMFNSDGKQYAIPIEWNNIVTHINTKMFEDAGIDFPKEDWTIDEFLEVCEKLTFERGDGTKQYAVSPPAYYFGIEAWLQSNGGSLLKDNQTKSNLLAPETIEVFQLCQDLVHKYGYAPILEQGVSDIQQLMDGNIAMGFWGRWPTTQYVENNFKDIGVQYVPQFKNKATVWGGAGIFSMSTSKYPDESKQLALYIASPPFIEDFMSSGAIPVLNSVAKKVIPELGIPKNNEIFFESASIAKAVEAPAKYAEIETIMSATFSEIMSTGSDVVETLTSADAQINSVLEAE